jgi:hypothetical protein
MGKFKLLVIAAVAMAMSIGLSGMAFAAKQGGCGWCHGVYNNISTYSNAGVSTNEFRDTRGVTASPTQGSTLPALNNDVGLHGIHMNYSSASYKGGGTVQKIVQIGKTGGTKSAFAVAPYGAVQRAVGPTAFGNYSAYVLGRGNCGYCHANSHPNHESGFLEWSSTSVPGNYGQATRGFIRYSSNQGGVSHDANGNALAGKISSLNASVRTGSCTAACHKGTSMTNPAPWGTYTTAAIKLTCNSCHADSSGVAGTEAALTGAHGTHLSSGIAVPGGTAMNASNNAGCVNCHTDNRGEGKTTKDWGPTWGTKAYPHATDGTNVVSDNATLTGSITSATKNGTSTTCATACHPRSNAITPALQWGDSYNCNMCHYYEATPTSTGNNAVSTGSLGGSHSAHFDQGKTCSNCHPVPSDLSSHNIAALPVDDANVTVQLATGTWTAGTLTCSNTGAGCHLTGSVVWGSTLSCASCHEYPNSTNIWSLAKGDNGHVIRTTGPVAAGAKNSLKHLTNWSSFNPATDTYAGVTGDATKCGKCHSGGTHQNATVDVIAPSSGPSAGFTVNHGANGTTCSNAKCHFERETPNWN